MLKCVASCDIIDEQGSNGTTIVWASNGPKVLLASSIPYLQFNGFAIDLEILGSEFDADGHIMIVIHFLLYELKHNAGLAHTYISWGFYLSLRWRWTWTNSGKHSFKCFNNRNYGKLKIIITIQMFSLIFVHSIGRTDWKNKNLILSVCYHFFALLLELNHPIMHLLCLAICLV